MKLSEIKGERAIEVIAELIDPVAEIASSEKIKELFPIVPKDGETPQKAAIRVIKTNIPELLKFHKKEVAKILGILENTDPEKLSLADISFGLVDLAGDKAFIELFSSAVLTEDAAPLTEEFRK